MSNLANLINKVRNLKQSDLWQLLPEDITDPATDSIVAAEYFTQSEVGDQLTDFQVDHIVDDLTAVLDFIKSANTNM